MRKESIAFIIIFMILLTNISSVAINVKTQQIGENKWNPNEKNDTLLKPEDEGDHFPCGCEWWCRPSPAGQPCL